MSLKLQAVTHIYQSGNPFARRALDNLNLQIEEGEFLVITGGEGSGKSTLLLIMTGLIKPSQGQITYQSQALPRRGIHPHLGLVFQYPEQQIFELTVYEEISFGPKNQGLKHEKLESAVSQAMKAVGLEPELYYKRSISELSSGEKRRVAIASILAMQPKILMMDEPLAGLDYGGRQALLKHLVRINQEQAITIVMVTHQLEPVYPYCSRVVQLNQGRVAGIVMPDQLLLEANTAQIDRVSLPMHVQLLSRLKVFRPELPASTRTAAEASAVIAAHWRQGEDANL